MKDILSLWISQLGRNPLDAVAAVLTGRMPRGALQQGDADEFFVAALAYAQKERQQVADLLDQGLLAWLESCRRMTPASISDYGVSALISRLERAFITVARARLPHTAQDLTDDHLAWDEWLTPLRRRDWIDVLDAFDEALAINQKDARLSPRWFDRLADAGWGGPAWRSSLRIGLVGLRKLPHPPGTQPESRVAAGLVHFVRHALTYEAIAELDVSRIFQREAMALIEIYYPRRSEHWQEVWQASLEQIKHVSIKKVPLRVWLHEQLVSLGFAASELPRARAAKAIEPSSEKRRAPKRRILPLSPPPKEEREALIGRFKSKGFSSALWKDIRSYVDKDWHYAEGSGEGYFVVRTVANFGERLLRTSMPRDSVLILRDWMLRAMSFAPEDPYLWDLWAKLQHALGRYEDALAVLWESVRRFPESPVVRTRLAGVLRSKSRTALAEAVLRDTMRDFPRNAVCRHALSELLRETSRAPEAEKILRDAMRDFPRNAYFRNTLAELLRETGRAPEAEQLLRETMRDFPSDVICRNALADLLLDQGRLDDAEELLKGQIERRLADSITFVIFARCKARRARQAVDRLEALQWLKEAREMIAKAIRIDPRNSTAIDFREYIEPQIAQLETVEASVPDVDSTWSKVFEDVAPNFLGMRLLGPAEASDDAWEHIEEPVTVHSGEFGEVEHKANVASGVLPPEHAQMVESLTPSKEEVLDRVKDDNLEQEADKFLRLNVAHGNEYADWYSAARGLNGVAKSDGGATNELEAVVNCLTYTQKAVVILPPDQEMLAAQPGSYSLRMLAAYGHAEHGAPSSFMDEVAALGQEFPDMRNWNDWLRLPTLNVDRKSELIRAAHSKPEADEKDFWSGRLVAVYPGLKDFDFKATSLASMQPERPAFERLVADVAIACAARSQPRVGSVRLSN